MSKRRLPIGFPDWGSNTQEDFWGDIPDNERTFRHHPEMRYRQGPWKRRRTQETVSDAVVANMLNREMQEQEKARRDRLAYNLRPWESIDQNQWLLENAETSQQELALMTEQANHNKRKNRLMRAMIKQNAYYDATGMQEPAHSLASIVREKKPFHYDVESTEPVKVALPMFDRSYADTDALMYKKLDKKGLSQQEYKEWVRDVKEQRLARQFNNNMAARLEIEGIPESRESSPDPFSLPELPDRYKPLDVYVPVSKKDEREMADILGKMREGKRTHGKKNIVIPRKVDVESSMSSTSSYSTPSQYSQSSYGWKPYSEWWMNLSTEEKAAYLVKKDRRQAAKRRRIYRAGRRAIKRRRYGSRRGYRSGGGGGGGGGHSGICYTNISGRGPYYAEGGEIENCCSHH